ncbi:Exocyst complex component 5 [Ceratocystis pirilliformis]|uniref:Exocyst complex component 5 n=1 Tax=Ceratocystis pirilliformis TaxID=259994 RepID=A0ABR3ZNN0_9PEZI
MAVDRAGGPGTKSLFPKGPSFSLDDFSSKDFIVRDFIDDLADSAAPANRGSGGAQPTRQSSFDPKPLIRTFENAVSQLEDLSGTLQDRESELLSQVRRAEIQHDQTLDTLGHKLDQSIETFEALDINSNGSGGNPSGFSNNASDMGGIVAVQIGERLEELDRKRRRAKDAIFLIQCWQEVGETGSLISLQGMQRHGGSDNKIRCAVIAKQLMRISQRLDPASWSSSGSRANALLNGSMPGGPGVSNVRHNTREVLEKFSEGLEQELLTQFNNSYRRQNFDDMRECAKVLKDFNDGASVIAIFVNQHQFFIDRDQLMGDEVTADSDSWDKVADPDAEPPSVEPSLQSLLDEVRIVMQEESFIIKRAFPYYETVLIKFIQRVFQQSIQLRLELVLDKATSISSLAFLRVLHSSRTYLNTLIDDLKQHGLTEHPEPCSAQVAATLDQQIEELCVPYLMGNGYIERERKSLEELYNSLLFKYTTYHSRRQRRPTGFIATLAQQGTQIIASAKDAYLERLESSDLTATQKAMMLRVAGITEVNKNDVELLEEDGVLGVEYAKRMLTWLAESVRRALELGSVSDTPKDANILMNLLLTSMGRVYIETALDAAADHATSLENSKTEPDMTYLTNLRPAITITSMMDRFISIVLIRLADGNATMRRNMDAQKRTSLDALEKKTNGVLKTTVDVVANYVSKALNMQKKLDFRPRDGDDLDSLQTQACQVICTFLARVSSSAEKAVDGSNLEHFSCEAAMAVCRLLFEHFKKFQVNATGGLMITQDIAKYMGTIKTWALTRDVEMVVEMLSEVGSLFIVGPEALREKARTLTAGPPGLGKRLTKADFKAFVQRRDDSGSVEIQGVLSGL